MSGLCVRYVDAATGQWKESGIDDAEIRRCAARYEISFACTEDDAIALYRCWLERATDDADQAA